MSIGSGVGLWESAEVRFNATGNVSVFTGAHSHGQGHDTTFAQIVGDKLGVLLLKISILYTEILIKDLLVWVPTDQDHSQLEEQQ